MKEPLKKGERVRVYDSDYIGNWVVGEIEVIHDKRPIFKIVGCPTWFHFRQCVRLRPKPKPADPKRREVWSEPHPGHEGSSGYEMLSWFKPKRISGHFVELKPSELILDRAALAKAWDSQADGLPTMFAKAAVSMTFADICTALGLPEAP